MPQGPDRCVENVCSKRRRLRPSQKLDGLSPRPLSLRAARWTFTEGLSKGRLKLLGYLPVPGREPKRVSVI